MDWKGIGVRVLLRSFTFILKHETVRLLFFVLPGWPSQSLMSSVTIAWIEPKSANAEENKSARLSFILNVERSFCECGIIC